MKFQYNNIIKKVKNLIKKLQIHYLKLCVVALLSLMSYGAFKLSKNPMINEVKKIPVTVMAIKKEAIELFEELPGRTVPFQIAEIRPQVTGIITKRLFEEGACVKEGDQLYQIDASLYQATYNSALADLEKTKANYTTLKTKVDRYEKVVKIGAVSKQNYDDVIAQLLEAKADMGIAEAKLKTAEINLAYTNVYAPISGRIGKSEVTKGALVTANQQNAIARITQLNPIYVDISKQSHDIKFDDIQENSISLVIDKEDHFYPHKGTLQFTDVTVDPTTNSVLLRVIFPNPDQALLPGSFVKTKIKMKESQAIKIPQKAAIRNSDGSANVWIVDTTNKTRPQTIKLGNSIGDHWIVESGLCENDMIIIEGFQRLTPGCFVKPKMIKNDAPAQPSLKVE